MPSVVHSKLFFNESRSAYGQVSELFDFAWPAAIALWNLRWQVKGFSDFAITEQELTERFVKGSGLNGVNLRKSCLTTTWEQQQSEFGKFILTDLFAIYEAWIDRVVVTSGYGTASGDFQKPTKSSSTGSTTGVGAALTRINSKQSAFLRDGIYPNLLSHKKNSLDNIEALMIAYRFFKECRNSLMHQKGIATDRAEAAFIEYEPLTASDLGVREKPRTKSIQEGHGISLNLRGVVGFTDVILRLIATLDAELSTLLLAERIFLSDWRRLVGSGARRETLGSESGKRAKHINGFLGKMGLPAAADIQIVETYLVQKNLISSV